jgi:3-oxoacyl-[acyl-carrier-protein] synthase II
MGQWHSPADRVVVTGIGMLTGLGDSAGASWTALLEGRSAIRRLDLEGLDHRVPLHGCQTSTPYSPDLERTAQLVVRATLDAGLDAGVFESTTSSFPPTLLDPEGTATVIGTSKGGLGTLCRLDHHLRSPGGLDRSPPFSWWESSAPSVGAFWSGIFQGATGPRLAPVAACATGVVAALRAVRMIRRRQCRGVFVGAADAGLHDLVLGAFRSMKALARVDHDAPTRAVRPWDRRRSGFLVGEGAAVLYLESLASALNRRAFIHAEIAGGILGADAHHLTDLNPDPRPYADQIRLALKNAGVEPEEIDHVNLHGTATRANDPLECQALRLALGRHAKTVSCSANKPQIGHMLGAAGAAELAFTCHAVRDQIAPPTLNLDDPDPLCDLDATPHVARHRPIRAALKLSLGFGGHVAIAVIRRVG